MAGIIGTLWKLYPSQRSKIVTKIISTSKLLSFDWEISPVSEECCHRMRHLALELSRAERILRNTFRLRMTAISTSQIKSVSTSPTRGTRYINGATATKGSDTEEWTGRVMLWGIVPLWRAAPLPDTVLALRSPIPADCWPFSGSSGELHIHLPEVQCVQSISVEHVQPDTARSAPKRFIVYGILANGTEIEIINSEYRHRGPTKQFFTTRIEAPLRSIIFRVLTNQGNLKYTCIYRVHLYGNSQDTFADVYN